MDGLIVVIVFAITSAIFVLFAYWTFSKVFAAVQTREEGMEELQTRIMELEERMNILEEELEQEK